MQTEGHEGNQPPRQLDPPGAHQGQPASNPPSAVRRDLVDDHGAAAVLGVGERTFASLLATADWLPRPIQLGPRLRRWDVEELLHAVRMKAPRGEKQDMPAQLRRARIERQKSTGFPA